MKWLNRILFGYFHFNKQERNGVFIFSLILLLLLVLRWGLPRFWPTPEQALITHIDFDRFAADTSMPAPAYQRKAIVKEPVQHFDVLFAFDPNTVSYASALRLGFSARQASTLDHFRNKGGRFRKPADLRKLYGMTEQLYTDLERYIVIPSMSKPARDSLATVILSEKSNKKTGPSKGPLLELNGADSLSLVSLRGIGPAFAHRILRYRSRLGGFYSIDQLHDVYGMKDSLFSLLAGQVLVDPALITKLQINTITFDALRRHPYLSFPASQAIINFRARHGKLNPSQLEGIAAINKEQLQKIRPYLAFD